MHWKHASYSYEAEMGCSWTGESGESSYQKIGMNIYERTLALLGS